MLPSVVAKCYNFPQGKDLKNQVVAIVELGGGYSPADIYKYCAKNGYMNPVLYNDLVDGATNVILGPDSADGEVQLDICVVAAIAQGVTILVMFGPNSSAGFISAIKAAVNHKLNPCAVSISWGSGVDTWSDQERTRYGCYFSRSPS